MSAPETTRETASAPPRPEVSRVALGALFAVALLLRLAAVWPDPSPAAIEVRSWERAQEMERTDGLTSVLRWMRPASERVAPETPATEPPAAGVGSADSLRAPRLAFAVLGALACVLLAWAGAAGGGTLAGWAAGALLAAGGVALDRSVTVGPAALLQLAGAGAFAGLLRYAATGTARAAALFGAFVGLGASVDGAVATLLLTFPFAVRQAGDRGRPHATRDGLLALGVAAAVFTLAAPHALSARQLPHLLFDDAPSVVSPLWTGLQTLTASVGWLPAILAALVILTAGSRSPARLVAAGSGAWLVATLLANGPRSAAVLALLPAAVLLAALGFAAIVGRFTGRTPRGAWAAFAVLVLVVAVGGGNAIAGRWATPPRERAVDFLRSNLPSGSSFWTDDPQVADMALAGTNQDADDARTLQPFVAPPVGTVPPERTIFHDPNLALFFPYLVLRDLDDPRFAKDERDRRLHEQFQDVFRSQWETRARFDSKRPEEPGITILARPPSYEMDRESHRDLFVALSAEELTAVRDSSRAFTDWLVRGGTMLRSVGEVTGADGYLRAAESRDDRRADVHFQLALVSMLVEHWEAAKGSLLRALAVDEKLGEAHYNLGMVFEHEGDVPGAEASYRAAILFSDNPLNAHARLGALLARLGDVEGALEELRTIRDIDPNSEAYRHLSAILTDT